jgi:hypothetical protein
MGVAASGDPAAREWRLHSFLPTDDGREYVITLVDRDTSAGFIIHIEAAQGAVGKIDTYLDPRSN